MDKLYPAVGSASGTTGFTAPTNLESLIEALQSYGCEVTNGAHYLTLRRRPLPALPAIPESVLALSLEQVQQDSHRYALTAVSQSAARDRRAKVDQVLDKEMASSMKAEADKYLDVLRPKFNSAAAEARAVLALGISPTDPAEKVMSLGGAAAERWISFKSGSASLRTLERITAIRAAIANATGAGEGPYADHSIGITNPFIPRATDRLTASEPAHAIWLRIAPHLELVPFAQLDDDAILTAQGNDVDELRSVGALHAQTSTATKESSK